MTTREHVSASKSIAFCSAASLCGWFNTSTAVPRWLRISGVCLLLVSLTIFDLREAFAQVDRGDRPVISLTSGPLIYVESDKGYHSLLTSPIFRELARQSVLAIVREDFGCATRDDALLESIDEDSEHLFHLRLLGRKPGVLTVELSHGDKLVYSFEEKIPRNNGIGPDRLTSLFEKKSAEIIEVFDKLGYQRSSRRVIGLEESKPLPAKLEGQLLRMNHVVQFQAVRELHRQISELGESAERYGGLARGYANLSQLTLTTLDTRSQVFAARARIYTKRMKRLFPNSLLANSTGTYVDAMLGLTSRSLASHGKIMKASADKNAGKDKLAEWMPLIESYCFYRDAELKQVANDPKSPLRELAALFRYRVGMQSKSLSNYIKVGGETLEVIPECQWIYDWLSHQQGVASGHVLSDVEKRSKAQSDQLKAGFRDWGELPDSISDVLRDVDEHTLDLFAVNTISSLLVKEAKADRQEPSLEVLGRNIEAWNVMVIFRRLSFLRIWLGHSPKEELAFWKPLYQDHPESLLLQSFGISPLAARKDYQDLLADYQFKDSNYYTTGKTLEGIPNYHDIQFGNISIADARAACLHYGLCCDHMLIDSRFTLWWFRRVAKHSPLTIAKRIRNDWAASEKHLEKWLIDYRDSPAVIFNAAWVLVEEEIDIDRGVELFRQHNKTHADGIKLYRFASLLSKHDDSDRWLEFAKQAFDQPDYGLTHSTTASAIAGNLMHQGKFKQALPWAERGDESGSAQGTQVLADCLTGLGRKKEASNLLRQVYDHYGMIDPWYHWCCENSSDDLEEAWQEKRKVIAISWQNEPVARAREAAKYHLLVGDLKKMREILDQHNSETQFDNLRLLLAVIYDKNGEEEKRDEILKALIDKGKDNPSVASVTSEFLVEYIQNGKYDDKILEKISTLEDQSYKYRSEIATAIFMLTNGRENFAIATLKRACCRSTVIFSRILAWIEVREQGVDPALLKGRNFSSQWYPKELPTFDESDSKIEQ